MRDLSAERVDYAGGQLLEAAVPDQPITLFETWLADALLARDRGLLAEPTATVLATCDAGVPSARTVLLKSVSDAGFVFFTNYSSDKGAQIAANPAVALHFGWYALQRQVRIEGVADQVSRTESEDYFRTRPRGSQLGAWASAQSAVVAGREELAAAYAAAEQRFAGQEVPCPPYWGGYLVTPGMIEFWQGQPSRMHDRLRYTRSDAGWSLTRLAP